MPTIKCPACGGPITLSAVPADGKITCDGCGKSFGIKKKSPAAAPPPPPPVEEPAYAGAGAEEQAPAEEAPPPPVRRTSGPVRRGPLGKRPAVRAAARPAASPAGEDYGEDFGMGDEAPPPKKGLPKAAVLGAIGGGTLVFILIVVFAVMMVLKNARQAELETADQILGIIALKWKLEAESVRETEDAWKLLRAPENAAFLEKMPDDDPNKRDNYLRMWLYVQGRNRPPRQALLEAQQFLKFVNPKTSDLLFVNAVITHSDGTKVPIDSEDYALDWMGQRGYKILESAKKKNPSATASMGGKIDSQGQGLLKLTVFGVPLEAEFVPSQSRIDITSGIATVAFRTNYPMLIGSGSSEEVLAVTAMIKENAWRFDFQQEIADHISKSGHWATRSFEAGMTK